MNPLKNREMSKHLLNFERTRCDPTVFDRFRLEKVRELNFDAKCYVCGNDLNPASGYIVDIRRFFSASWVANNFTRGVKSSSVMLIVCRETEACHFRKAVQGD